MGRVPLDGGEGVNGGRGAAAFGMGGIKRGGLVGCGRGFAGKSRGK
jgi:hypothetical protein